MTIPRRRLLRSLVLAPLAPAALAEAQVPQPTALPATPLPAVPPPPPTAPSPSPSPVAEALGEVVRHRYGAHLGPGELDEIKRSIEENLRAAERLHRVSLLNGDEPVTRFEPVGSAPAAAPVIVAPRVRSTEKRRR